jgi:adenylate kinase
VLDGFPKTSREVGRTEALLTGGTIDLALLLDCVAAIRDERVSRRYRCGECSLVTSKELPAPCEHVVDGSNLEQRSDDKPEALQRRRLHEPVEKLAAPFEESSRLVKINSEGPPEEVFQAAVEVLRNFPEIA